MINPFATIVTHIHFMMTCGDVKVSPTRRDGPDAFQRLKIEKETTRMRTGCSFGRGLLRRRRTESIERFQSTIGGVFGGRRNTSLCGNQPVSQVKLHPGPRMPPPETGRDDLAPGLAHAVVAVLIYALLARRRRCCESKQRSGKRE